MSPKSEPPPRVARAAEKADLGYFRYRHDRRTPAWRYAAEVALLVPPLILLFASNTGRPDDAWGWLAPPVGLLAEGVGYWRLSPLLSRDDLVPASALARDLGKLALYTALLGGYLAWQWRLGWPDNSFGDWLTVVAVAAAVPVLAIGFDVLFLAYAPWYTFSGGLLIGDSWGGQRRVVRYADVKTSGTTNGRRAGWRAGWRDATSTSAPTRTPATPSATGTAFGYGAGEACASYRPRSAAHTTTSARRSAGASQRRRSPVS
ncbi:hypothetical protein [Streptomyces sp. NPDC000618]|uniref:hypothetical protein n=1 Tax=Streptomyces sp. NPDC000618 TaxID=3154265 RepID=UPI00332C5C26